jgi:hypothetical protein
VRVEFWLSEVKSRNSGDEVESWEGATLGIATHYL